MNIVSDTYGLRFERSYHDIPTVLEGEELQKLFQLYLNIYDEQSYEDQISGRAFVYSAVTAYQSLYPDNLVPEEELEELNTGDSRKMDLLFRGLLELYSKPSDLENEYKERISTGMSILKVLNEILELKPNFFGIGIDLNAIITKYITRKKR